MDPVAPIILPEDNSDTAKWIFLLLLLNLGTITAAITKIVGLIRDRNGTDQALQVVTAAVENVAQNSDWAEGSKGAKAVKIKVAATPMAPPAQKAMDKALAAVAPDAAP